MDTPEPSAHDDEGDRPLPTGNNKEVDMKSCWKSFGIMAFFVVLFLSCPPEDAQGKVNLNINIGSPPVVVAEPAEVVLIPGSGVYFVADAGPDLFFHEGFWWSHRGDRWFRSRVYSGPWIGVERRYVPVQVVRVPRDYRVRYGKARHVPYGQWKKAHYKPSYDNGRHGDRHNGNHHQKGGKKGHGHDDR
jgi:hypothetical protein